ncbi:uncharacterized protein [Chiloscyllium punctatum]|uniref:uncharacterized protein isoform X2 n=1 Tax=Chiloscyllium punctatum TaxID=137246 RepID=UPI003B63E4AF
MFKNGIETTESKSITSKKQIEVNITVEQNKRYDGKCKFKSKKKKTKKSEMEQILLEITDVEVCRKLKMKKKKRKSTRSSISDEEQGAKIDRNIVKGHSQESEIDEASYHLKKKKKKKKKFKTNEHSDPQSTCEKGTSNISENDQSRVQVESDCNIKKKKKINFENSDAEEGFTKSKMSNNTADKLDNTAEVSCVVEAKSVKRKKKKKRSHSEDFDTSENEKSTKKWQRDINDKFKAGNDKSNQEDRKKQKDEQILDTLETKCTKKKKKRKLHAEESEEVHKGGMAKKRKEVEQIENNIEYISKSHRKRKISTETKGEGIETNLDKTNNICKLHHSSETAKGKKQETTLNVLEDSVKIKTKTKRKKKDVSSVMQIKEELCDNDDLQIMSEKKGNVFEVTIDKARRQALQEEIDKLSGKTGTSETKASPEIKPRCTGTQWDTATFENTEQKNKFLRLMGGFKTSNQPPSSASSSGKQNVALNKEEEQNLNRTLQKEFDKALNLRQHRGIGLGFQPFSNPANKIFFIDKYASKSTKFNFN